jgi:ligand-binding sensor domain-containing protein
VYDRQAERWTTFETGLPSMNVTALAVDSEALYVGTDNGIVRIMGQTFSHL